MKKLLLATLLAAGAIVPMSAQGLYFQNAEGTDLTGQTYVYAEYETYPYSATQNEIFIDPHLFILSTTSAPVSIKTTANYPIQLCIGGQCTADYENLKEGVVLKANEPENMLLDCSIYVDKNADLVLPAIEVLIEAWYDSDPNNVTTMILKMGDVNAGVESIAMNGNSVVFDGKSLTYDVTGASQLNVYSLSGKTVLNKNVAGNGALSLEGLSKGIYLYRLTNKNGKTMKSAKIIIK